MSELAKIEASPDKDTVTFLEQMLEQAKSGELQGVVFVCSWRANMVSSGWSTKMNNRMRIIGELAQLQFKFCRME